MSEWREVVGFPDYLVSSEGQVKRKAVTQGSHGRPLKPIRCNKWGHVYVNLFRGKKRHPRLVHRVVLEAFAGACPDGMDGAHLDGNPGNNTLNNLKWATRKENESHKKAHGTYYKRNRTHGPDGRFI